MAPSTSDSVIIPYSHHDSRRLLSLEDQGSTISILSRAKQHPRQIPIPGVQTLDEKRRPFLASREVPKRLSRHLTLEPIYTTTSITPTSLNRVYNKKQSIGSASILETTHSIAIVPMASESGAKDTIAQAPRTPPLEDIDDLPDDQSSICHSPTWGNEKNKKRASTSWKWRRASFSKAKKDGNDTETEETKTQTLKTSKKLNKKPPPAMETQRQSATLASTAINHESPPAAERRPSSSSGSFTQAMRGFMSRRSSQNITPETSRPASVRALRSEIQELKSREMFRTISEGQSKYEEDEVNADDIAIYIDEVQASVRAAVELSEQDPSTQVTTPPVASSAPIRSAGQEATNISQPSSPIATRETSVLTSKMSRIFGKKDNAAGGYKYPGLNNKSSKSKVNEDGKSTSNTWLNRNFGPKVSGDNVPQKLELSSSGGYVQRQRSMHHQRSMRGFRDEMAVKSAYDQLMIESQSAVISGDNSGSVHDGSQTQSRQQSIVGNEIEHHREQQTNNSPALPPKSLTYRQVSQSPDNPSTIRQNQDDTQGQYSRSLPATPAESGRKKLFRVSRSTQDVLRPAPTAIQWPARETRNSPSHSASSHHHHQQQSQAGDRTQFKTSSTTINSSSTDASSSSSIATQQMSPVYQLPGPVTSKTSPAMSEQSGGENSPPMLSLDDSTVRLVRAKSQLDMPPPPPPPTKRNEILEADENAQGINRNSSLKKHRSHPELKTPESNTQQDNADLLSLDFLPELKHQSFTKPKRYSRAVFSPGSSNQPPPLSPSQFPLPSSPPTEVARRGGNQMRTSKRTSTIGNGPPIGRSEGSPNQIAKLFVICCQCKYWHDLPSKVYEAMALPQPISQVDTMATSSSLEYRSEVSQETSAPGSVDDEVTGLNTRVITHPKCPWCPHFLSTNCCQGWTAVVNLHTRHH